MRPDRVAGSNLEGSCGQTRKDVGAGHGARALKISRVVFVRSRVATLNHRRPDPPGGTKLAGPMSVATRFGATHPRLLNHSVEWMQFPCPHGPGTAKVRPTCCLSCYISIGTERPLVQLSTTKDQTAAEGKMVAPTDVSSSQGLAELFTDQTKSFVYGLQPVCVFCDLTAT